MQPDPIARVRRFNRAVTTAVGALDTSFLGRGRRLGAARLLWSIAADGSDVADLRIRLRLDSGLMSRLLRGLEAEGLVITSAAPDDRRRRIARLTPAGHAEKAEYDRLNDRLAAGMIARAPRNCDALLAAMDLIAINLDPGPVTIAPADPAGPEARACLAAYFRLLGEKIDGISAAHVPDPAPKPPPTAPRAAPSFLPMPMACPSPAWRSRRSNPAWARSSASGSTPPRAARAWPAR